MGEVFKRALFPLGTMGATGGSAGSYHSGHVGTKPPVGCVKNTLQCDTDL